jgi:hypothetical protein
MNKRTKLFLLAAVAVIFIGVLTEIDYKDLSWSNNSSLYLAGSGIIIMIVLLINSLIFSTKDL